MKKKFINIILVIFGFFFFSCFRVNADVDITLNFDIHEHFNYFYEFQNNTPFYQFIIGKGSSLSDYLKSYQSRLSNVFFAYASDLTFNNYIMPEDSYYSIILPSSTIFFHISYSGGTYYIYDNGGSASQSQDIIYLFFDSDMNFLESKYIMSHTLATTISSSDGRISYVDSEFAYILGSYYGYWNSSTSKWGNGFGWCYSNSSCSSNHNVRVTNIFIHNTNYHIENLETYSGWQQFLNDIAEGVAFTFGGRSYFNLNDLGLGYFTKNYALVKNNFLTSIYSAFSYSDTFNYSVSVPNGYSSQAFNYNNRYFLIPNSTTCSNAEMLLYFNTSDTSTINFISYDLLQDTLSYDNMKTYSFKLKNANSIEALSLHSVVGSFENIVKNFYLISSSDNFGTNTLYYNPSCYSTYSAIDNNNLTFTNVNTGNQVIVTSAEKQLIIYNSNETIDDIISSGSDLNLTDIISGAWSGAKTFVSASYYILSMSTTLFTSLPNEVKGLLLCVFSVGMIVILWKVFRS